MLKVIEGQRAALEAQALRTIWLGSPEDADRLLARLKRNPDVKLELVKADFQTAPLTPVQETE